MGLGVSVPPSCPGGCQELCPVKAIAAYLSMSPDSRGILFRNSISEASPNCLPRYHDIRKMATLLVCTRGLSMIEITRRAFWRSSNPFIDYLFNAKEATTLGCVALNTYPRL